MVTALREAQMTLAETQEPATGDTVANYYDLLGLGRDDTVETILENLHDIKLGWQGKANRAGSLGEEGRAKLVLIDQAREAFADEDARERYDMALLRAQRTRPAQDEQVDWLSRAWTYYFLGEDGAGAVAARKAREQSPDNAMVYVVSAWIKLRQDELKQAKQDADEAFVLDELAEDTTDVHHVRGFIQFLTREHDKARNSFERALATASTFERPEILLRTAWNHEAQNAFTKMFEATLAGLSAELERTQEIQARLTETAARSIVRLSENPEKPQEALDAYRSHLSTVESSTIDESAKVAIRTYLEQQITRNEKLLKARSEIARLQSEVKTLSNVKDSTGVAPSFPLIPAGIVAFSFLMITVGWFFLLVALAVGAYAVMRFTKRQEWLSNRSAFTHAQSKLEATTRQLGLRQAEVHPLMKVEPLEVK